MRRFVPNPCVPASCLGASRALRPAGNRRRARAALQRYGQWIGGPSASAPTRAESWLSSARPAGDNVIADVGMSWAKQACVAGRRSDEETDLTKITSTYARSYRLQILRSVHLL